MGQYSLGAASSCTFLREGVLRGRLGLVVVPGMFFWGNDSDHCRHERDRVCVFRGVFLLGSSTTVEGASSVLSCLCEENFYMSAAVTECILCFEGFVVAETGVRSFKAAFGRTLKTILFGSTVCTAAGTI